MEKQLISALAVFLFCLLYTAAIAAQTKSRAAFASPEETRAEVRKLGFGKRVKIKLGDGTKVRGRITGLADDQFIVTDSETGSTTRVGYANVASIGRQREMPKIIKGAVYGVGVTAAVVGTLVVLAMSFTD